MGNEIGRGVCVPFMQLSQEMCSSPIQVLTRPDPV